MSKNLLKIIIAVVTIASVTGCRSQKGGNSAGEYGSCDSIVAGSAGAVQNASLPGRYAMLTESWKPWRDVEMGVKFQLQSPARLNAAGKIWMKRGEWISVSIRMIGFEVATLWLDKDSVVAVDKYHKKYVSEPTSRLLGSAGVTISDIQDLLTGRAFLAGEGTATPAERGRFDFEQAANGWYLLPRRQPQAFNYGFLASDNASELRGAIVEVKNYGSVSATYAGAFESRTCGWFSPEVTVTNSRGKKISATLKWDLNGARFNTGVTRSCKIPDNCEKIDASTLTSLLKKL